MSGRKRSNESELPSLFDDAFWDGPAASPADGPPAPAADGPAIGAPASAEAPAVPPHAASAPRAATATAGATPTRGTGARRARAAAPAERLETRARARALQALYAADLRPDSDLRRVALQVFDDLAVDPAERPIASALVERVHATRTAIDADLEAVTANWRLERLGAIERSVLRLAAAELESGVTPPRVVLQEAVRLAERFGTPKSARFVNGVLDAYARRRGHL